MLEESKIEWSLINGSKDLFAEAKLILFHLLIIFSVSTYVLAISSFFKTVLILFFVLFCFLLPNIFFCLNIFTIIYP